MLNIAQSHGKKSEGRLPLHLSSDSLCRIFSIKLGRIPTEMHLQGLPSASCFQSFSAERTALSIRPVVDGRACGWSCVAHDSPHFLALINLLHTHHSPTRHLTPQKRSVCICTFSGQKCPESKKSRVNLQCQKKGFLINCARGTIVAQAT